MAESGDHIVPSPEGVSAFVHATALSMKQMLDDTKAFWGPIEWGEYYKLMRAKLALIPDDRVVIQFCHDIQLAWNGARQREFSPEKKTT